MQEKNLSEISLNEINFIDRKYFTFYRSDVKTFIRIKSQKKKIEFVLAIMLYQLGDYDAEQMHDFFNEDDEVMNSIWESIKENQINSKKRFEQAKAGGIAKASKSKAKSTKPTKTIKTKKKSVKSNPPNPETVIQPEEMDDVTNFDIIDNRDGSYVDEPEVTEDVAVLAKPKDKDLSKSEVVSLICLNLETASEMAIQIYNYRVLKKVSNSEKSIEKFCNEIDANAKKYKKPKILFVENYVAGTWLEFIKTLEGANDDLVVANTGVLVPNVEGSLESSVSVDNKAVSLITEQLGINEDLAKELHKFWIGKGKIASDMFVLSNCTVINRAVAETNRSAQEVILFIFQKDYKSFSSHYFINQVAEEDEALKAMKESNENKPNESLQLFLSNVEDLHMAKAQIKRKKERNEKLTKEEEDFLGNHRSLVEKEEREYAERGNPGYASDAERAMIFREKIK